MDKEIPKASSDNQVHAVNPSPEDQRRFQIAVELIRAETVKDICTTQVTTWSARLEATQKKITELKSELEDLKKGQMVML